MASDWLVQRYAQDHGQRALSQAQQLAQAIDALYDTCPEITPVLKSLAADLALFAPAYTALWDAWWQARAPGTAQSREAVERELSARHLAVCAEALRIEASDEQQAFLRALCDYDPGRFRLNAIKQGVEDRSLAVGAVLIQRLEDPHGVQARYQPHAPVALVVFADAATAEASLAADEAQAYLGEALFDYLGQWRRQQALALRLRQVEQEVAEALPAGLSEALWVAATFDAQRCPPIAPASDSPSLHSRLPPLLFGCLEDDWPLAWREQALASQRDALFDALARDPQATAVHAAGRRLEQAYGPQRHAAAEVVALIRAGASVEAGQRAFDRLLAASAESWRAQAQLMHCLGQLPAQARQWLEAVLPNAPEQPGDVSVVDVQWVQAERTERLPGVRVIAPALAFTEPAGEQPVLLMWPGSSGGLRLLANVQALHDALRAPEQAEDVQIIHAPVPSAALSHALAEQLQAIAQATPDSVADDASPAVTVADADLQAISDLSAAHYPARDAVLAQHAERQRALSLAQVEPGWLGAMDRTHRAQCLAWVDDLCTAIVDSRRLFEDDLQPRPAFAQALIEQRLREDFGVLAPPRIRLDIPESVSWVREFVPGSGAPSTPERLVPRSSAERVQLELWELALMAIDESMAERLGDLIVTVDGAADAELATRLCALVDKAWLTAMVAELDVAAAYEHHVRAVYTGFADEPPLQVQWRRERVVAPYRCQLHLQAVLAYGAGRLSEQGARIAQCAIDADSAQAYQPDGWDIVLHSARLAADGRAESSGQPVTLAGITFIEERTTGITLLHLPDAPGRAGFSEHASLEAARQALVDASLDSAMADYLSHLPMSGDPGAHAAYLLRAQVAGFDGFIVVGGHWLSTTSLAALHANLQMGRMIEAHRLSARSQADLYLQAVARGTGDVFNYIKMALGFVPFVGAAIAAYDALVEAYGGAKAFVEGRFADGIDHVRAVLLAVIDGAVDVAPSTPLARAGKPRLAQPGVQRFDGYEVNTVLAGYAPGTRGRMAGVYAVLGDHYVRRDGKVYGVRWDDHLNTWRLKATAGKTYPQPITLDALGRWDTHGAVHGALVHGGLQGGGAYLGRLANHGWTGLSGYVRRALRGAEDDATRAARLRQEWSDHVQGLGALKRRLKDIQDEVRADPESTSVRARHEAVLAQYRDFFVVAQDKTLEMGQDGHGRRLYNEAISDNIEQAMKASRALETYYLKDRQRLVVDLKAPVDFDTLDSDQAQRAFLVRMTQAQRDIVQALEKAAEHRLFQEQWFERMKSARGLTQEVRQRLSSELDGSLSVSHYRAMQVMPLTILSVRPAFFQLAIRGGVYALSQRILRTVSAFSEVALGQVVLSNKQRLKILGETVVNFQRIEIHSAAIDVRYRAGLEPSFWSALQAHLKILGQEAQTLWVEAQTLADKHATRQPARKGAPGNRKRVFETVDDESLIGQPAEAEDGSPVMQVLEPGSGTVAQTYRQRSDQRWALVDDGRPATTEATDVSALSRKAKELMAMVDPLMNRVQQYARQGIEPASLEDVLHLPARELQTLAAQLEQASGGQADSLATLRQDIARHSERLLVEGTRLRVEAIKASPPTAGYLDYLVSQRQAFVEKVGPRRELRNARGKIEDYLQEYAVKDADTSQPLWYAHLHYRKANAPARDFSAAHLKTPEQRRLGVQSQRVQAQRGEAVVPILRAKIPAEVAFKYFTLD